LSRFFENGVHPNQFYRRQSEFFESALNGFRGKSLGRTRAAEDREKNRMEAEIQRMKDVIAEVVSENIEKKKEYGIPPGRHYTAEVQKKIMDTFEIIL